MLRVFLIASPASEISFGKRKYLISYVLDNENKICYSLTGRRWRRNAINSLRETEQFNWNLDGVLDIWLIESWNENVAGFRHILMFTHCSLIVSATSFELKIIRWRRICVINKENPWQKFYIENRCGVVRGSYPGVVDGVAGVVGVVNGVYPGVAGVATPG